AVLASDRVHLVKGDEQVRAPEGRPAQVVTRVRGELPPAREPPLERGCVGFEREQRPCRRDPVRVPQAGHGVSSRRTTSSMEIARVPGKRFVSDRNAGGAGPIAPILGSDGRTADEEPSMPEPRVLMEGIAFGEQPRWHEDRLWFSDWGPPEVIAVDT